MIFDDHDVHDDWNTSIEWVTEMREKAWWRRRIVAAFESYIDLPAPREPLAVRAARASSSTTHLRAADDPTRALRAFAQQADEEVEGTRWSFCRDIGPARVVMIDSRAGRVLDPGRRAMVDHEEWRLDHRARVRGRRPPADRHVAAADHGPGACTSSRPGTRSSPTARWGKLVKKLAEKLRQELDLEHWPAFQESFRRMCDHLREVGAGRRGAGAVDDLRALRRRPPRLPRGGRLPARVGRVVGRLAGRLLAVPQPAGLATSGASSSPPGRARPAA